MGVHARRSRSSREGGWHTSSSGAASSTAALTENGTHVCARRSFHACDDHPMRYDDAAANAYGTAVSATAVRSCVGLWAAGTGPPARVSMSEMTSGVQKMRA